MVLKISRGGEAADVVFQPMEGPQEGGRVQGGGIYALCV